jgi:hypothetical protein
MLSYLPTLESHLRGVIAAIDDPATPMWPSVVDTRTGRRPEGAEAPRRVYRLIGAPRGSTLYWDMPLLAAAERLSELTGDARYAGAADRYVESFLDRCVAENGLFQWGNHQYYDVFEKTVVSFHGGVHELRPLTPVWDFFWNQDPERTYAYIKTMARRHVYDPVTGGFNRHDDGKRGHAFIESGGILVESLAWLYSRTGDHELLDQALRIASYSYGHRGASTGLVRNEPDMGRWDAAVSTSEIGVWAQSLLRAGAWASTPEFTDMAAGAVRSYAVHAFDAGSRRFFGQVRVEDGAPVAPAKPGYWPRLYANAWNTDQWPTHDYPMAAAEACLTLHGLTRDPVFLKAVQDFAADALATRPALAGGWSYAENYGRCLHLLTRAGRELGDAGLLASARNVAGEAVDVLFENGLFQGYPGGHAYESVDGVGYLALALLSLESGREAERPAFGF